jgi:hypothetical protein
MSGLTVSASSKSLQKIRLELDLLLSTLMTPYTSRLKLGELIITIICTFLSMKDLITRQKPGKMAIEIWTQLVGTLLNSNTKLNMKSAGMYTAISQLMKLVLCLAECTELLEWVSLCLPRPSLVLVSVRTHLFSRELRHKVHMRCGLSITGMLQRGSLPLTAVCLISRVLMKNRHKQSLGLTQLIPTSSSTTQFSKTKSDRTLTLFPNQALLNCSSFQASIKVNVQP